MSDKGRTIGYLASKRMQAASRGALERWLGDGRPGRVARLTRHSFRSTGATRLSECLAAIRKLKETW